MTGAGFRPSFLSRFRKKTARIFQIWLEMVIDSLAEKPTRATSGEAIATYGAVASLLFAYLCGKNLKEI